MKKIKINLSVSSIRNAQKELERYRRTLKSKNVEFVQKLAEIGIPIVNENVAAAQGDSDKTHNTYIKINSFQDYAQATLVCEGSDILFIEFGAGVHYNTSPGTSPNPKGAEMGYTIGSYGKGNGKNDSWFYTADTGESVRSFGTEATMPMYKASVEIIQKIHEIAKEVFGGGI